MKAARSPAAGKPAKNPTAAKSPPVRKPAATATKGKAAPAKAPGKTATVGPSKAGQKPITFKPGGLHRSTGTPAGQKIPAAKMAAAASGKLGPKAQKQAQFARNVLTGPKKRS